MRNPFRWLIRVGLLPNLPAHVPADDIDLATAYFAAEGHRQAVALATLVDAKDDGGIYQFTNGLSNMELRLVATALAANWVCAIRRELPFGDEPDVATWLRVHAVEMERGLL